MLAFISPALLLCRKASQTKGMDFTKQEFYTRASGRKLIIELLGA